MHDVYYVKSLELKTLHPESPVKDREIGVRVQVVQHGPGAVVQAQRAAQGVNRRPAVVQAPWSVRNGPAGNPLPSTRLPSLGLSTQP